MLHLWNELSTFTKKNENERMYLNEIGVYNERRD